MRGRGAGLDDPPTSTRTRHAARITSGRPGPPVAPRPAGCPILTRGTADRRSRNSSGPVRRRTTVGAMRYPEAPRLDLVEDLHGHRVADPYRWLEDAADPRTAAWSEAQDALAARGARRPAAARGLRRAPGAAGARRRRRRAGLARAGGRSPPAATPARSTPSCGCARPTAPCGCWSTRWRWTRRGRRRSTPGRRRGRATGWPTSCPPAATRSRGSTSSTSPPARCVDGPIDRCRYSPVAWLPGGEELFYVRRLAPDQVPAGEEQFHRRVWRHRVGAARRHRRAGARRGQRPDHLLRRAHQPRRPLAGRLRRGRHRAARRRLDRRPRRGRRAARVPGRRRRADRRVGRPRRPAVADVRPRHPALAARRRRPGRPGHLGARGLAGRRPAAGRTPSSPTSRWSTARTARCRCSPCTPSTPPTGSRCGPADGSGRLADVAGPGRRQHLRRQLPAGGRQRRRGSATPTTPRRRRCCAGTPARPTDAGELGAGRRRRRGAGADRRRDARDRRPTARRCTCSCCPARCTRTGRGRPCSTATAASTSR